MAVQPITPQEALDLKITTIPDEVIETVNDMLAERMTRSGHVTIVQKDLCHRICLAAPNIQRDDIFSNGWLC